MEAYPCGAAPSWVSRVAAGVAVLPLLQHAALLCAPISLCDWPSMILVSRPPWPGRSFLFCFSKGYAYINCKGPACSTWLTSNKDSDLLNQFPAACGQQSDGGGCAAVR